MVEDLIHCGSDFDAEVKCCFIVVGRPHVVEDLIHCSRPTYRARCVECACTVQPLCNLYVARRRSASTGLAMARPLKVRGDQ